MLKLLTEKISKSMIDPQIIAEVSVTIDTVRSVGLTEAWFSIETSLADHLMKLFKDRGYWVEVETNWNYPEGLYVGTGKPTESLTMFKIQWK